MEWQLAESEPLGSGRMNGLCVSRRAKLLVLMYVTYGSVNTVICRSYSSSLKFFFTHLIFIAVGTDENFITTKLSQSTIVHVHYMYMCTKCTCTYILVLVYTI